VVLRGARGGRGWALSRVAEGPARVRTRVRI